jgi:hypothetical protein
MALPFSILHWLLIIIITTTIIIIIGKTPLSES